MDSIEHRLTEWGKWAQNHDRGGFARPLWARMVSNGGIRAFSPDYSIFPTEIEQTERAIAALKRHSKYLKRLIFMKYLNGWQAEVIASEVDRPIEDVKASLDRARDWIGDYIEGLEIPDESARI